MNSDKNCKILIIDELHPFLKETLTNKGCVVDVILDIDCKGLSEILKDYSGLILRSKLKVSQELIDSAPKLEFIARAGSGMENIDTQYAAKKGIACISSPEANSTSVAEHATALTLSLLNKILKSNREVRSGKWERNDNWGTEIEGKTIGLIGYGHTGRAFARRISSFGVRTIAYDKYLSGFSDAFVEEATMTEIFCESDILSLHVPQTNLTKNLVKLDYIKSFKKPFFLINTSRGKIVNTSDLLFALEKGIILGAALDVLEFENSDFESLSGVPAGDDINNLIMRDNVIITPHVAGWTNESYRRHSVVLERKISELFGEERTR